MAGATLSQVQHLTAIFSIVIILLFFQLIEYNWQMQRNRRQFWNLAFLFLALGVLLVLSLMNYAAGLVDRIERKCHTDFVELAWESST